MTMVMTLPSILFYMLIAAVCGALGRAIVGDGRGGFLLSFLVGLVGAFIGPVIANYFKLAEPLSFTAFGHTFGILWAVVGSAVFMVIVHLFSRRW
jgi:uncharacterized membrane protein YeaQ/YmgE (transglycosylase-associated protein family)